MHDIFCPANKACLKDVDVWSNWEYGMADPVYVDPCANNCGDMTVSVWNDDGGVACRRPSPETCAGEGSSFCNYTKVVWMGRPEGAKAVATVALLHRFGLKLPRCARKQWQKPKNHTGLTSHLDVRRATTARAIGEPTVPTAAKGVGLETSLRSLRSRETTKSTAQLVAPNPCAKWK